MQLGSVRVVAVGALLLAGGTLATVRTADAAAGPTLKSDTRTSQATVPLGTVTFPLDGDHPQPDTEIEPSIAVNPANPLNAVTAFQEDRIDNGGDGDNGYASTFDGGKSWSHGYLPGLTTRVTKDPSAFERASDAVVAFGPRNVVYANSLVFDNDTNNGLPSGMAVNVSYDGGRTWSAPVFLEQDSIGGLNDKNWIVVDNGTGAGHHNGRVYVFWDRIAPMVYAYCDPGAVVATTGCEDLSNWSNAPENNGAFYTFNSGPGIGSVPLVLPDGSVGVMFEGDFGGTPAVKSPPTDQPDFNPGSSQIQFEEAPGAGSVPFPAPLTFNQQPVGIASNQSTCCAEQRAGGLPAAAVDPLTGQIYVAWEDSRFRTDGLNDAVYSTSTNGVTWTPVARINHDPVGDFVNHYNTMIDVGGDGRLHVAYRQRYEKPGAPTARSPAGLSPNIDTYYQESSDRGVTWTASLKVNTVETNVGYAAFSRGGAFQGDYNQIAAASNGTAYIVRDESYAIKAHEPCGICGDSSHPPFTEGNGHQHQFTWVAVVRSAPATSSSSRAPVAAALLFGGAAGVLPVGLLRRRRRSPRIGARLD